MVYQSSENMRPIIAASLLLLTSSPAWSSSAADAALERADAAISGLERLGASECPPTFTVPGLLKDASRGALKSAVGGEAARLGVRLYYFCAAFTRRDPAVCYGLSVFAGSYSYDGADNAAGGMRRGGEAKHTWPVRCLTSLDKSGLAKSKISGDPGFREVCRAFFITREYVRHEEIGAACELLSGSLSDLPKVCARLVPLFMDKITTEYCVANIGPFVGDRGSCAAITQAYSRAACLGHADYADFARGAAPAACEASPFCRMMRSGRPEDCGAFLKDFAADACRDRYRPEYVLERGRAAEADLAEAQAGLDAPAEPSLADDALAERAIRLRLRWKSLEAAARAALKP